MVFLSWFGAFFRSGQGLGLELVALRQQVGVLNLNVTEHPTGSWIVQQLREAFPEDRAPQYLILDRDAKFEGEVATMLKYFGRELVQTAYRTPGAERGGGALGGKLSPGTAGPRDRPERIPSASAGSRLPRVLPRGSHS
jgi:hypothetical protein